MHELSIVETLIEQVDREVRRAGHQGKVTELHVSVGRLSGVNPDSLRFAFQLLSPDSVTAGAGLHIAEPAAICRCRACGTDTPIDELVTHCPNCGSAEIQFEGGRDLTLDSIELQTAEEPS